MTPEEAKLMEDYWLCISEQGLAGDIMNDADILPETNTYEAGDPVSLSEFSPESREKLLKYAGGLQGMQNKLEDEGYA